MQYTTKAQLERINQQIKELAGVYRAAVSGLGISENEFWIWYALINMDGELSQQDICGAWAFSKQTVNTIISHMVKNHYATLEAIPGTRNRKRIRLTEEGRRFGERIVIPFAEAEVRALERIPLDERSACIAVLAKYAALLREELRAGPAGSGSGAQGRHPQEGDLP